MDLTRKFNERGDKEENLLHHLQLMLNMRIMKLTELGWHFSFLCDHQGEKSHDEKLQVNGRGGKEVKAGKSKHRETSSDVMIITKALHTSDGASVLPTFTCEMLNGALVRGLKDCGCQTSFVTEKLACDNKLKVLEDNVSLTVNGFNSSKMYKSKIVELKCNFDDKACVIHALCVPSIDINLSLPGISEVARAFAKKGFKLADKYLTDGSDKIKDIDLILGTNDAHCLLDFSVQFGDDHPSVYLGSSAGVMLMGNVKIMQQNLPYLSKDFSCSRCSEHSCSVADYEETCELNGNKSPVFNGIDECCKYIGFGSSMGEPSGLSLECDVEVQANFAILNEKGMIEESELRRATDEMLRSVYEKSICEPDHEDGNLVSDCNGNLIKFTLDNARRNEEGRLEMPLLWNEKSCHLLGRNFDLAKAVLRSNTRKLQRNKANLELMNENFKEQEDLGIIERIPNLERYMDEHPECSFLAHMGVFRLDRETTKCRVVFLSNVCEPSRSSVMTVNHNQAMYAGPSLNQKITSALLHLRFGSKLLIFDIKNAFNQIALSELDQQKLLFLWYKNVKKGDFSIIAYKNVRLPFGLRCSPTILMLALFKILVLDSKNDNPRLRNAKCIMYQLFYMDNGGFTCESSETLNWMYEILQDIFGPYKIELQQMFSNDSTLQDKIDGENMQSDLGCKKSEMEVKLLGMIWNRRSDTISTRKLCLDEKATTKREILQSIASNYDVFNINGPLLNRARLLCRTCNRCVGERTDEYKLEAYVDASKRVYGVVVYLCNMRSGERSFVLAKNRLIGSKLHEKSIPSLELQAICLGTEVLLDTYNELSGTQCLVPIKIVDLGLFSDSFVALSWLKSFSHKFDKMQKRSVFVMNKLNHITKLCEGRSVGFSFVSGMDNPADKITRCLSFKSLMKSNYHKGPNIRDLDQASKSDILGFKVPMVENLETIEAYSASTSIKESQTVKLEHLIPLDRYSNMDKLISTLAKVLECWDRWKGFINKSHGFDKKDLRSKALIQIISRDQQINFPDVIDYLSSNSKTKMAMPNLISLLNLYPDTHNLIRVNCKFNEKRSVTNQTYPILLSRESTLTKLIILDEHLLLKHAGCYALLTELRRKFWIPKFFSTVKRILKECVVCRRYNQRPVKLNQSAYREFRLSPSDKPFGNVYLDYCGPFYVRQGKDKVKFIVSDLGTQIVAGANIVQDFLKDAETVQYLTDNNVEKVHFQQYYKGCSQLGGLVESVVKMTKHMIQKSIRNNVIEFRDFEYLVCHAVHLINRRPIAFKEALRDCSNNVPTPITPEELIHGYSLVSLNIIPALQADPDSDEDFQVDFDAVHKIKTSYEKLKHVRTNLLEIYHREFMNTLIKQATDKKDRYAPVNHKQISIGDIVLIKDDGYKPVNYPMGIVKEVFKNINGEVTAAKVLKGKTNEITKRHVTSLIPLLRKESDEDAVASDDDDEDAVASDDDDEDAVASKEETPSMDVSRKRPLRKAAEISRQKFKSILNDDISD
ncbi:uncharacterized protein [Macrobrachium rosenbergii]|uniref:uncharacterized protein n=1 Tax=Macrobrachium rosenbergii TaxID=79674 RepID=UPI0034D5E8D4